MQTRGAERSADFPRSRRSDVRELGAGIRPASFGAQSPCPWLACQTQFAVSDPHLPLGGGRLSPGGRRPQGTRDVVPRTGFSTSQGPAVALGPFLQPQAQLRARSRLTLRTRGRSGSASGAASLVFLSSEHVTNHRAGRRGLGSYWHSLKADCVPTT